MSRFLWFCNILDSSTYFLLSLRVLYCSIGSCVGIRCVYVLKLDNKENSTFSFWNQNIFIWYQSKLGLEIRSIGKKLSIYKTKFILTKKLWKCGIPIAKPPKRYILNVFLFVGKESFMFRESLIHAKMVPNPQP